MAPEESGYELQGNLPLWRFHWRCAGSASCIQVSDDHEGGGNQSHCLVFSGTDPEKSFIMDLRREIAAFYQICLAVYIQIYHELLYKEQAVWIYFHVS